MGLTGRSDRVPVGAQARERSRARIPGAHGRPGGRRGNGDRRRHRERDARGEGGARPRRKTRPQIAVPKMLLPVTAHACFHKAAHYLGVEVVVVDVDPVTFRADMTDARAEMSDDVVLVVGSAPSYAHGVIDPIPELATLAAEHGALMHVDACVGGCVLPFLRDSGVAVAPFDFAVPGVTSISLDLHKYGFAPKGISVLLQRRPELRRAQYFACATWTDTRSSTRRRSGRSRSRRWAPPSQSCSTSARRAIASAPRGCGRRRSTSCPHRADPRHPPPRTPRREPLCLHDREGRRLRAGRSPHGARLARAADVLVRPFARAHPPDD